MLLEKIYTAMSENGEFPDCEEVRNAMTELMENDIITRLSLDEQNIIVTLVSAYISKTEKWAFKNGVKFAHQLIMGISV